MTEQEQIAILEDKIEKYKIIDGSQQNIIHRQHEIIQQLVSLTGGMKDTIQRLIRS